MCVSICVHYDDGGHTQQNSCDSGAIFALNLSTNIVAQMLESSGGSEEQGLMTELVW